MITGQFNDSFPPIMDGVANVVKNYAYWLNKKYGKSYVITPSFPKHEDNEDFTVYRYLSIPLLFKKPYRLGLPLLSTKVRKDLYNIEFDILHTHSPFSAGAFAMEIAKKKKVPIITTFHSKLYDDFKEELKSESLSKFALEKTIEFYNSVDYVWAVSKGSANTLKNYGYSGYIDVIPNGTDFTYPNDYDKRCRIVNEKYNISHEELVLLYTGQLIWQKNIELIAEAIASLKASNFKCKILIAGEGNARKEFFSLIKELGIEDYIIYAGVITNRDDLKSLFARADLFVFPSVYDNAPIVLKEAAAMKTPALLVKGSNAAEGIIHEKNGYLCENNVECFVRIIKQAVKNKEKLKQVGENAFKTVYKSWESIIDEVNKKYHDILVDTRK